MGQAFESCGIRYPEDDGLVKPQDKLGEDAEHATSEPVLEESQVIRYNNKTAFLSWIGLGARGEQDQEVANKCSTEGCKECAKKTSNSLKFCLARCLLGVAHCLDHCAECIEDKTGLECRPSSRQSSRQGSRLGSRRSSKNKIDSPGEERGADVSQEALPNIEEVMERLGEMSPKSPAYDANQAWEDPKVNEARVNEEWFRRESRSKPGYFYYMNRETGETCWDTPRVCQKAAQVSEVPDCKDTENTKTGGTEISAKSEKAEAAI
mmetsp:Transcript_15029/g.27617  ORF Transcript_15029/g.27617 Transcript_15029/m.27617 type:complete len:265 (-) Transcript_15029:25-819(-)